MTPMISITYDKNGQPVFSIGEIGKGNQPMLVLSSYEMDRFIENYEISCANAEKWRQKHYRDDSGKAPVPQNSTNDILDSYFDLREEIDAEFNYSNTSWRQYQIIDRRDCFWRIGGDKQLLIGGFENSDFSGLPEEWESDNDYVICDRYEDGRGLVMFVVIDRHINNSPAELFVLKSERRWVDAATGEDE